MEVLGFLGFLALFGSLLYLIYHFIRKIKDRERTLNKKKFYPVLAGSFALFIVGLAFSDTGVQTQLNEALETNTTLINENEELEEENEKLKKDNDVVTKERDDLTTKLTDFDKSQQALKDQQAEHKGKTEAFEKEITDLKATNKTLTAEVDSLKNQVASKSATSTASSSGGSSSSSADTSQQSANVYYKNCTAVRDAGADPIYRGEPGYAKHLDRDGDGVGCE